MDIRDGISVIVCCYNSAWVIARCLEALRRQKMPEGVRWEALLVDNNCTDNTVAIAQKVMDGSGVDFQVVSESEPGLMYARQRGMFAVKYSYIVFCDDDNLLCENYVAKMYEILSHNPKTGAAGGKGVAEFECEPDPRILPKIEGYAVGSQLGHKNWLFGAGMAVRTDLVQDVYANQRRYLVGRKGTALSAGDDTELSYSILLRGYGIQPTDDVFYTHVLKSNRLSWDYCQKMYAGFELTHGALDMMRRVLEGRTFRAFLCEYFALCRSFAIQTILFMRPSSRLARKSIAKQLHRFNYWGLFKLWEIFNEWTRLKIKYSYKVA